MPSRESDTPLTGYDKVRNILVETADSSGLYNTLSNAELADFTGLAERTVVARLNRLEADKVIKRYLKAYYDIPCRIIILLGYTGSEEAEEEIKERRRDPSAKKGSGPQCIDRRCSKEMNSKCSGSAHHDKTSSNTQHLNKTAASDEPVVTTKSSEHTIIKIAKPDGTIIYIKINK